MSTQTPTTTPIITAAAEAQQTEVVEKQSFVAKTKNFVRNHKKPAYAAAALVGLVGISALAGRKTAPLPDLSVTLELEPPHVNLDVETTESEDTNVA